MWAIIGQGSYIFMWKKERSHIHVKDMKILSVGAKFLKFEASA
jgi:hypothetical protein